jgi:hypothetical protein
MTKRELVLLLAFLGAAVVVAIQRGVYGFPNDYAIFRASYWNLISQRDLYVLRLDQARDYFKYSPTFALLFAPFALLPFLSGLILWNVVNALTIWLALRVLLPKEEAPLAQALVFLPTLRAMQSSQSNALVAALIIFAFVCYERGWRWRAGWSIALGAAIKIFPLAAATFVLPRRYRVRSVAIALVCTVVLVAMPLLVTSPSGLIEQYRSWGALEKTEATQVGSSAMVLIRDAGLSWPAWPIQVLAAAFLVGALALRAWQWGERGVRLQFLALTLVFCVVFNHRAERQSAVIAVSGLVIWFLVRPRAVWRTTLFAIVYLLVDVTGADFVPATIKHALSPELRFTIPLTVAWLAIFGELVFAGDNRRLVAEVRQSDPVFP